MERKPLFQSEYKRLDGELYRNISSGIEKLKTDGFSVKRDNIFIYRGYTPEEYNFELSENSEISYITTLSVDRDNSVVLPDGMDTRGYNNIVLAGHDYRDVIGVGRCHWLKLDRKGILAKTEYFIGTEADKTDENGKRIWNFIRAGFPLAKSIGFIPKEWAVNPHGKWYDYYCWIGLGGVNDESIWQSAKERWIEKYKNAFSREPASEPDIIFIKWYLLEYSVVTVPSNVDSQIVSINKSKEGMQMIVDILSDDKSVLKPYENEHSCRLHKVSDYDKFRRKNCEIKSDSKCIDVIYGIKGDRVEHQSYRYKSSIWTREEAQSHCKESRGSFEPASTEAKLLDIVKEVKRYVVEEIRARREHRVKLLIEKIINKRLGKI